MKWFKKKSRNKLPDLKVIEISLAQLARQILHDGMLGEDAEKVASAIGLPPMSEDVFEMEEEASERRVDAVMEFMPLLEAHARIMGDIAMAAYKIAVSDTLTEEDEPLLEEIGAMMRMVAFSSSLSALTMLYDMGLVSKENEDE